MDQNWYIFKVTNILLQIHSVDKSQLQTKKQLKLKFKPYLNFFPLRKNDFPEETHPTNYKTIKFYQQKDKNIIKIAKTDKNYSIKQFHGTGKKYLLICYHDKIIIPKQIQTRIVQWYHDTLSHPGKELTISQYFYWKNLNKTVQDVCTTCDTCQRLKRNKKNYGKLPPKQSEATPQQKLCIDFIGKYKLIPKEGGKKYEMTTENGRIVYLQAVTMIDPATGWVEIRAVPSDRADLFAQQVALGWLTRYPLPETAILYRGNEFLAEFKKKTTVQK